MSKTERAKQKTFADDYAQYAVPKKPHKALYAAAGVAGAAAVLVGGVFGLKFLAEHGGLKGPDVQGGPGYHDDTAARESKDIMDAVGDVIEFRDMTATIEQVLYDGHTLRVIYRVDSYDKDRYGSPADATMLIEETSDLLEDKSLLGPDGVFFRSGGGNTYDKYTDETDHRNIATLFRELSVGERTHLEFLRMDGSERQLIGSYTLNGIDTSENSYVMNDSFTVPSEAHHENDGYSEKTVIDSVELTPLGAYIMTSNKEVYFNEFSFGLIFRDGSAKELVDIRHSTLHDSGDDTAYYGSVDRHDGGYTVPKEVLGLNREIEDGMALIDITSYLYDPVDVNDIAAVIINGKEIPLNVYTGMELDSAKELLAKNGINYQITEFTSEDIPEGCVIRTEPEPGLLGEKPEMVTLYVSKEPAALNVGDRFRLNDGATAAIDEILYDGFMFKTVISVQSDDPDYYTKKTERFGDGNLFVCTDLGREWQTGVSVTASPDENGCDVIFTYYSVIPADTERHSVKIWDDSEDINRTVGYIVFGYSGDDAIPYTRTVGTESVEFGKRELTVSPYGFRLIQNDSNYQLDPYNNKITVTIKDGRVLESTVTATGEQSVPDYADYQLLFGLFDEPFDLVEVYSLNFFGETFVLNDSSEMIEITETNE